MTALEELRREVTALAGLTVEEWTALTEAKQLNPDTERLALELLRVAVSQAPPPLGFSVN